MTRLDRILLFGYFLLEQYLHFRLNKLLQNMVCCTYFNNQKELGVDVLDFQFELGYLGTVWTTFPNIRQIFVQFSGRSGHLLSNGNVTHP